MKKVLVLLSVIAIVYTDDAEGLKSGSDHSRCKSMSVLNKKLTENPGLERKMYNIELHSRKAINAKTRLTRVVALTLFIPEQLQYL